MQELQDKLPKWPTKWIKTFMFSRKTHKLYLKCEDAMVTFREIGSSSTTTRKKLIREWSPSDIQLVLQIGAEYEAALSTIDKNNT